MECLTLNSQTFQRRCYIYAGLVSKLLRPYIKNNYIATRLLFGIHIDQLSKILTRFCLKN